MRHRNKTKGLGRKAAHRKAMLANMATSLIMHKRIKTTVAKAKVLRTYIEPIITKSKNDTTHNRRTAFRYLRNKYAVTELFRNIAPKVAERPGGYTRILKIGNRPGDNAEICIIELVDFNTTYNPNKAKTTKKRRSRRGGKKKTTEQQNEVTQENVQTTEENKTEEVVEETKQEEVKNEEVVEKQEDTQNTEDAKNEESKQEEVKDTDETKEEENNEEKKDE